MGLYYDHKASQVKPLSTTQQISSQKKNSYLMYALCHFVVDLLVFLLMLCAVSRVLGDSGQGSKVALSIYRMT